MSILRPFRAVRPAEGLAPSIAALPYDVYTTEEARRAVEAGAPVFPPDRTGRRPSSRQAQTSILIRFMKRPGIF